MVRKLDTIDLHILAILQRDGRITNQRLSEQVGLSARPCLERVRRLEEDGVISRYMAILDPTLVGRLTTFFAEITQKDQSQAAQTLFETRARQSPEVIDCYLVGGAFDYIARIACSSLEAYRALTQSWIDDQSLAIARIETSVVLKPVCEFGGYPLPPTDDAS